MQRATPTEVGHVTEADLAAADERIRSSTRWMVPLSLVMLVVVLLVAGVIVTMSWPALGGMRFVFGLTAVTLAMIGLPVVALSRVGWNRSRNQLAASFARERELGVEARRREFETRLANALEMAENEEQVMIVAGRALRHVLPKASVELLLADNSHAHLQRTIVSGPTSGGPSCRVESPDRCVASRRGQTQVFDDSDALDACPYLEHRPYGRCAAVCVPVSIMGRTVGVVHRADPLPVEDATRSARPLEVLANQLGARLGMLRVMVESQLQASTDPLTGLPNRRAFENRVRGLHQRGTGYALVLADLDHFKVLNDTHGHETGDRALRTFAAVLRESLRDDDLVCRHGGEEFAFVLPGVAAHDALAACDRVRESLALVTHAGDVVPFTASFGIAMRDDAMTYEQLRGAADVALYRAKHAGRNRAELAEIAG